MYSRKCDYQARLNMKISSKYRRILEVYLEWENVRTPASGSFQESKKPSPEIGTAEDGLSAAEALCIWESQGKPCNVHPDEWRLLCRYERGKSQRDWWSKEIGWWNKNAAYNPEEFLRCFGPLPFIDLFGRGPITRFVRYYYDNHYSTWEFCLDNLMLSKIGVWKMSYYDRDDRDSALYNTWKMFRIKWVDPRIYKLKRKFDYFSENT